MSGDGPRRISATAQAMPSAGDHSRRRRVDPRDASANGSWRERCRRLFGREREGCNALRDRIRGCAGQVAANVGSTVAGRYRRACRRQICMIGGGCRRLGNIWSGAHGLRATGSRVAGWAVVVSAVRTRISAAVVSRLCPARGNRTQHQGCRQQHHEYRPQNVHETCVLHGRMGWQVTIPSGRSGHHQCCEPAT